MKHLRRIVAILVLAIFGGLLWLGHYAHSDGLTNKWKKRIREEFAKHHILVEIPKLTIDPFQGLVANDVQLLQDGTRAEIASISKVRLDLDLAKFLRKESSLQRIELASTDLSLPYNRDDPESQRVELKDLNATIHFKHSSMDIAEVLADFYGVRLRLTGSLLTRNDFGEDASVLTVDPKKIDAAEPVLTQFIEHCQSLSYPEGKAPLLNCVVTGDLTKPETLTVVSSLKAEQLHYGDFKIKTLEGDKNIDAHSLDVTSIRASDDGNGWLQANLTFPFDKAPATFKLESSLALDQLAAQVIPDHFAWEWLSLDSRPIVDVSGSVPLRRGTEEKPVAPIDVMGTLSTGAFRLRDEWFKAFSGGFHVKGKKYFCRDLELTHERGSSKGKLIYLPEEGLRYDMSIGMDPQWMQAFPLSPEVKAFLKRWQFNDSSTVAIDVNGRRTLNNQASWEHEGRLNVTHCDFDSVALDYLTVNLKVDPYTYYFSDLQAQLKPDPTRGHPGGTVEAENVNLSTRSNVLVLSNVRSRVHPAQVVRCFDKTMAVHLDQYTFDQAPEIKIAQGTVDLANTGQTNLRAEIKVPSVMSAPVMGKTLPFSQPRFQLFFYGESLLVRVYNAGLLEGNLDGQVEVKDLLNKRPYSADLNVKEVDFGKLATYYFPEYKAGGQLSGNLKWSGIGAKRSALTGGGVGHLLNCPTMHVPVLGPLSALLDSLVGKSKLTHGDVRDLWVKFYLASGNVVFEEITADMDAYRITGKGEMDLASEQLDFEVALKNQTTAGMLLNVVYSVFGTYECEGTLDDPKWRLANRWGPEEVEAMLKKDGSKVPLDPEALLKLDPTGILKGLLDKRAKKPKEQLDKQAAEEGQR